jgi:riboflavin synthase
MFTGIIKQVGVVEESTSKWLKIRADTKSMRIGDSISVNGVCLTLMDLEDSTFQVELMPETLSCTNLGLLQKGEEVNLEEAISLGGKLGGHLVLGHVDDVGRVSLLKRQGEAIFMSLACPSPICRYVVNKGPIAIDGVSLTVVESQFSSFQVSLVRYTQEHTTLGKKRIGNVLNLEVDIFAKYAEKLTERKGINLEFLTESGFI